MTNRFAAYQGVAEPSVAGLVRSCISGCNPLQSKAGWRYCEQGCLHGAGIDLEVNKDVLGM
nr:hypothetical protein [Paenibacillus sp. S-12]